MHTYYTSAPLPRKGIDELALAQSSIDAVFPAADIQPLPRAPFQLDSHAPGERFS